MRNEILLSAVGDVTAFFSDPESAFEYVLPLLQESDILFAQNERHYTDRLVRPAVGTSEVTSVRNGLALGRGGFDVFSFASNHCMDFGPEVMMETVGVLRDTGAEVVGVGLDIMEARKPAILERSNTRVGFLAYASVLRDGYEAGPARPGCAPMRAYTHYHQVDYQPGTPPRIVTFPHREDLDDLVLDVASLRDDVDVLVVSLHWGVHFVHGIVADYQRIVARAVIDAGVDIVLGHHPHVLKGIEIYKGKPVIYSMGNFALDLPAAELEFRMKMSAHVQELGRLYDWAPNYEWPLYSFPEESRRSMIVRCLIADRQLRRLTLIPVAINGQAQPEAVSSQDPEFDVALRHIGELSASQGFTTRFSRNGEEILVDLQSGTDSPT